MTQPPLPQSIISPSDVHKIQRELADLSDYLLRAQSRPTGTPMELPKTSNRLEELSKFFNLNLLKTEERTRLEQAVELLVKDAPQVHISFASAPSVSFMTKLIEWFRREIHPNMLIKVGLQPSIAAGCILRTNNKYFDFSLRSHLDKSKDLLLEGISGS